VKFYRHIFRYLLPIKRYHADINKCLLCTNVTTNFRRIVDLRASGEKLEEIARRRKKITRCTCRRNNIGKLFRSSESRKRSLLLRLSVKKVSRFCNPLFKSPCIYPSSRADLATGVWEVIYLVNYEIPRLRPVIYVMCVRQAQQV